MHRHPLVASSLVVLLYGCGGVEPSRPDLVVSPGPTACDVPLPDGFLRIAAGEGVAFQVEAGVAAARGEGCALAMGAPVAAGALVDVGAAGDLYVHASGAYLERELPDVGLNAIVRVREGRAPVVVATGGRGIERFGVSLTGRSYWMQGVCGGLGVYSMGVDLPRYLVETETRPSQLALSDDEHFWFLTQACGPATCATELVRTGLTDTVRWNVPDASARLARCHDEVCVFTDSRLTRLAVDGAVRREETLASLGARDGERIEAVTASRAGLYVTLTGPGGLRVRFLP
jgi:hypothetical protein